MELCELLHEGPSMRSLVRLMIVGNKQQSLLPVLGPNAGLDVRHELLKENSLRGGMNLKVSVAS